MAVPTVVKKQERAHGIILCAQHAQHIIVVALIMAFTSLDVAVKKQYVGTLNLKLGPTVMNQTEAVGEVIHSVLSFIYF